MEKIKQEITLNVQLLLIAAFVVWMINLGLVFIPFMILIWLVWYYPLTEEVKS